MAGKRTKQHHRLDYIADAQYEMGLLNEEKEDEAYYKDMNKNNHDESETDFNDLYDILFLKNNDFYKIFNVQTEQIENIMEDKEVMEKKDYKLLLSNLSRLIPSDFYGNRVSTKPECLFKSWKKQYQKYNQNSNDALKKYHTSLEYKYEVTLDLENFFPTINPIIIYHYIVKNLPAHLKKEDMNLMKRLLRKLLFCKLVTQLDEKMLKQYYKAFKSQTNNKETVKKSKDINVCGNIKQCEFARGIAQTLRIKLFGYINARISSRSFRGTRCR